MMAVTAILKSRNIVISRPWSDLATKFDTLTQFDALHHSVSKIGPSSCTCGLVYAYDVSCSFSKRFAVQNENIAYLNLAIKQQICMYKKTAVYTHC